MGEHAGPTTEKDAPSPPVYDDRCCLDDWRDHTPLGCTRCGCLMPVWTAGRRVISPGETTP